MQKKQTLWAMALVQSLLLISLAVFSSVLVHGSVLDASTMVSRGEAIRNSTAARSEHSLQAGAENSNPKNNYSKDDSDLDDPDLDYLYYDEDDETVWLTDEDEDEDWDFDDEDLVLLDRSSYEGADDLSENDWTWTVFFDGLKQGHMIFDELKELYDCPSDDKDDRIPIDAEPWKLFEEAYYSAVGMEVQPLPRSERKESATPTKKDHPKKQTFEAARGMKIPYEINYEGTYPTIVAATLVPKGAEVWTGSHTAGFTQDPSSNSPSFQIPSYHRFIDYLNERFLEANAKTEVHKAHNWACDALTWTVSSDQVRDKSKFDKGPIPALCVSFDHGSLIESPVAENPKTETLTSGKDIPRATAFGLQGVARAASGVHESSTTVAGNTLSKTKKVKLAGAHCQFETLIAGRDIQPGEELNFDYYGERTMIKSHNKDQHHGKYVEYYDNHLDGRSSMFF